MFNVLKKQKALKAKQTAEILKTLPRVPARRITPQTPEEIERNNALVAKYRAKVEQERVATLMAALRHEISIRKESCSPLEEALAFLQKSYG